MKVVVRRGTRAATVLILLLATASGACGTRAQPSGGTPRRTKVAASAAPLPLVRIQVPAIETDFLPLQVAQKQGYFARLGVRVQLEVMKPVLAVAALLGRRVQFIGEDSAATQAAWQGAPIRIVMGLATRSVYSVVGGPAIKSVADLKGKAIASGGPQTFQAQLGALALQREGLSPSEVTFVGIGSDPQRLAALQSGSTAGALLDPARTNEALQAGMHVLVNIGDIVNIPASGLATTTAFIRAHPRRVRAVVVGAQEGIAYVRSHPNTSIALIGKEFKLATVQAKAAYQAQVARYNLTGVIPESAIRKILALGAARFAAHRSHSGGGGYPALPPTLSRQQVAKLVDFQFVKKGAVAAGGGA